MFNSLWPHGLQNTRTPSPPLFPGVCSNLCPLYWYTIQPSHPRSSLLLLPSIFPRNRVFCSELALHIRWPKYYWSVSFSISPSSAYSGLISFRIDWFDLLVAQGTPKTLLQYYNSKASIILHSAFFMVQLSYLYMTTRKTMTLTIWTFVGKVMSLLFNMLSRLVIAFLPRSKPLLISWVQSPSGVMLEPRKIKAVTVSTLSPSACHEVMRLDAVILCSFECWVLSQFFHSPLSLLSSGSLFPLLPNEWYHLRYMWYIWGCWYFSWQSWFLLVIHLAQHFAWYILHIS